MVVRNSLGQNCDDRMEGKRDVDANTSLDCNNYKSEESNSSLARQFHREVEIPSLTDPEERTSHEKSEQMQNQCSNQHRLEFKNQNLEMLPQGNLLTILRTDASQTNRGATITFLESGLKEMHEQSWKRDSKLTFSNKREAAAILLGLRRFALSQRHNQIKALRIESVSSSAGFNINRGAAGQALQQIDDQTIQLIQQLDLQLTALHIPELINKEADQLSRLAAAGDYQIREEVLEEALLKCRRLYCLKKDPWAVRQDGIALPWKNELPRLRPPIALIQRALNKIMKEEIRAVLITPYWKAQTWWPDLEKFAVQQIILGDCMYLLILGYRMKKKQSHLPPGELLISLLEGKRRAKFSDYWETSGKQLTEISSIADPLTEIVNYITDLDTRNASPANIISNCTANSILFQAAGHLEEKIEGFIIKHSMKKLYTLENKEQKEEKIWGIDILLTHIKESSAAIKQMNEKELLGGTLCLIIAFSTLRMSEVHRSTYILMEDGSCKLQTDLEKGPEHKTTIIFRSLADTDLCPIIWIKAWINFQGAKLKKKQLWFLRSMHRMAKDEELSKAIHLIMDNAGIPKGYTVVSIRKASIAKAVAQGASKTDINRFSRHSEGSNMVMFYYDTNLNDNIRM
ncbi:MAG: hypothetical protein EZS28_019057 [Streblomastix strix]|uniref:Tyr recombinase domain-containing protein n=1 Tax=Streblomastix strix TaxID=222440 RepID=A0A5J4VTA9_9EUKA|nr:MAG: hypothetical protein EZS28_019057 [Streblomastix strix]